MNLTILDVGTLGEDIELSMFDKFGDVKIFSATQTDEIADRIKDCDVVVVNKIKLNSNNLKKAKKLKIVCVTATGFDNIDLDYCSKNNIAVCNVKGYSTNSVAQVTAAMVLSLANNLSQFDGFVKSGKYTESGIQNCLTPVFHELCGKTWGIVGLGVIGKKVADIARALGCKIIAFKQTPDESYECVSLPELCRQADIISVHLPLTEKTHNIINADMISKMKSTAIVINVARGAVVDESALTEAILNKKLGGLGIDVYNGEPMSETSPYRKLFNKDNVILTPHMAWGAYETRVKCMEEVAMNIDAFLNGEMRNRVEI